jgi:hypothetical protein
MQGGEGTEVCPESTVVDAPDELTVLEQAINIDTVKKRRQMELKGLNMGN